MKLSNGVEKYEIEVTKMGLNYSLFLTVIYTVCWAEGGLVFAKVGKGFGCFHRQIPAIPVGQGPASL